MKEEPKLFDGDTISNLKYTLRITVILCGLCMGTISGISGHFIFYYSQNPIIQIAF